MYTEKLTIVLPTVSRWARLKGALLSYDKTCRKAYIKTVLEKI